MQINGWMDGQMGRRTDDGWMMDGQVGGYMDICMYGWMGRMYIWMNGQIGRRMDVCMDRWIEEWIYGQMNGWMDRWREN